MYFMSMFVYIDIDRNKAGLDLMDFDFVEKVISLFLFLKQLSKPDKTLVYRITGRNRFNLISKFGTIYTTELSVALLSLCI